MTNRFDARNKIDDRRQVSNSINKLNEDRLFYFIDNNVINKLMDKKELRAAVAKVQLPTKLGVMTKTEITKIVNYYLTFKNIKGELNG